MIEFYLGTKDNMKDNLSLGLRMGEGFISALDNFIPLKEFVTNESRLEHGKRVIVNNPKKASREVTLAFVLCGSTRAEYVAKRNNFEALLNNGIVSLAVPMLRQVYKLLYTGQNVTYAMNRQGTRSKISIKFEELDPTDRS